MKFEIDFNDILGDEYGVETLQESVRRQVIDNLTTFTKKEVSRQISEEVNKVLNDELKKAVEDLMPVLVTDLLDAPYLPVDRYGSKGKETTFRSELLKTIQEQCVYKKSGYSSNDSFFTKAVDAVIYEQMESIKKEYKKLVDESIAKDAFNLAINTLKTKLGLG